MRQIDNNEHLTTRNAERTEDTGGVILPRRVQRAMFQGWGPKLLAAAIAVSALVLSDSPANASTNVALGLCEDHGATLVNSPLYDTPENAAAGGETVLRINLSAEGQIQNLAVAQSSGDPFLDNEAMRVARESQFAAAIVDCRPAADIFLYRVVFTAE